MKKMVLPNIGGVELRVVMQNANDHIYQIRNGSRIGVFSSQYGPRRAIFGGIKWDLPWGKTTSN